MKIPGINVVEQTWHNFAAETSVADQSQIALERVYNYFVANKERFWRPGQRPGCPINGWAGKVNFSGIPSEEHDLDFSGAYLGFIPAALDGILKEAGFDANAVIRQWKLSLIHI